MMFLTLKEYLTSARKLLALYGYNCHKQDEDAIAYVAHCMMNADHTWDGEKSNRNTWRFNQAKYAIMKLKTKHRKERKNVSLHTPVGTQGAKSVFLHDVLEAQDNTHVYQEVAEIMTQAKNCLTERQYTCLDMYYLQSMTLQQIGDEFGWTREYIRQILHKAISKLRNECGAKTNNLTS